MGNACSADTAAGLAAGRAGDPGQRHMSDDTTPFLPLLRTSLALSSRVFSQLPEVWGKPSFCGTERAVGLGTGGRCGVSE